MKKVFNKIFGILLIGLLFFSACQSQFSDKNQKLKIVTTTGMLGDLAKNIGGEKVEVEALMGPGVDPHLYKASAGDLAKLERADLIVLNGLHLEAKMGNVLTEMMSNSNIQVLPLAEISLKSEDLYFLPVEAGGAVDPHVWFDIALWRKMAKTLAEELAKIDEKNARYYRDNYVKYDLNLFELDKYVRGKIESLPEEKRVLVTAHGAFNYFARSYGFEVRGLQGISTIDQASVKDVQDLVSFIVERKVAAIFVETSVATKHLQALIEGARARGFEVKIGGQLYSDALGDKNSGHDTYLTMFKANVDVIVDSLK